MIDTPPATADVEKRRLLERLLDEGLVVVHLDPRRPGVDLPAWLVDQPSIALNLSRNFGLDVFEIDGQGVQASLSFQGRRHHCRLPWSSIYLMANRATGQAYVFPRSVPGELADLADAEAASAPPAPEPPPEPPPRPAGRPQLRLVKNEP